MDFIERVRERRARAAWSQSGAEDYYGPFPGLARASVILYRGANREARERLIRQFVSLPIRWGAAAMLALVLPPVPAPAGVPVPAPAPRALSPQRRCHRPTPARAP